jgi:RNA polymerase sigma-70 factor (ECF subfamily)
LKTEFDALYRDHYRRVYGLCLRLLRVPVQAEEAAQEVFVRAYRAFDQYDTSQPFAAWVLGIASNHCIDLIRRRSREGDLFGDADAELADLESETPDALEALVDAERASGIRMAIAALPDKYRLPIVLAYYNEWSYEAIAAELGITRNHVGVLLLRARRSLRSMLAGEARS